MHSAEDHRAVIRALHAIVRPADVFELAELADLPVFHVRACLVQLAADRHVMALNEKFGRSGQLQWQLTARGYADHVYGKEPV